MIMTIVFPDDSKIVGERGFHEIGFFPHETKGTHHFTVIKGTDERYNYLLGHEIAVPISSAKFFILD